MRVVFKGSCSDPLLLLLVHSGADELKLDNSALRRPSYQTALILLDILKVYHSVGKCTWNVPFKICVICHSCWSHSYLWHRQTKNIPLGDQVSSDQSSCESIPDLNLSCRITADDCVVRQEGNAPNNNVSALGCPNTSLHQHSVCGMAWIQQRNTQTLRSKWHH